MANNTVAADATNGTPATALDEINRLASEVQMGLSVIKTTCSTIEKATSSRGDVEVRNALANVLTVLEYAIAQTQNCAERIEALAIDAARRAPVRTGKPAPGSTLAQWRALVAMEQAAMALYDACDEAKDPEEHARLEKLWDQANDDVMRFETTEPEALLYKFNQLFSPADDGGTTACWSWAHAGHTIQQVRAMLEAAAKQ